MFFLILKTVYILYNIYFMQIQYVCNAIYNMVVIPIPIRKHAWQ